MTYLNNAVYLYAEMGVRYWEDAKVDGIEDTSGELICGRDLSLWKIRIELSTGVVKNWNNTKAEVHYKVCDDGHTGCAILMEKELRNGMVVMFQILFSVTEMMDMAIMSS